MTEKRKYIIDTNSLINSPHILEEHSIILPSLVLREIEKLELKKADRELQYNIRVAKRMISKQIDNKSIEIVDVDNHGVIEGYASDYVDNQLVSFAKENNYGIITDDKLMIYKATALDIEILESTDFKKDFDYKGYVEIHATKQELMNIYLYPQKNEFGLLINQYAVLKDENNEVLDAIVWNGEFISSIFKDNATKRTMPSSKQFERIQSRDVYQAMTIDSLYRNQVTMVRGKAGSGKTLLSIHRAWNIVEEKDGRLVIFFNPAPSKDSITMGFNKGDLIEKAMQSSLGAMLKSKFGDENIVRDYIMLGTIEIFPFTDLRGWDSKSSRKTVVLISEAQNLTSELLKMGLQRIDDDTQVIIDGDYNQQVDRDAYLYSNGMKRASEVLRGNSIYGEVELQNVYRSKLASVVDEM